MCRNVHYYYYYYYYYSQELKNGSIPTPGASSAAISFGKGLTVHYLVIQMGFKTGGSMSVPTLHRALDLCLKGCRFKSKLLGPCDTIFILFVPCAIPVFQMRHRTAILSQSPYGVGL